VQIIEPLVFDREPPTNWCHYEYACFSDNPSITKVLGPKDRHFFILTDPEIGAIQPAAPYPPFDPWMDRIKKLKHIALRGERNITLREKVREIATQILALRKETIESWLA